MLERRSMVVQGDAKAEREQRLGQLKRELHCRLIQNIDPGACRKLDDDRLRRELRIGAEELCRSWPDVIHTNERRRLIDEVIDETLGFGPLEPLLRDPTISDILINGPRTVFVERAGKLEPAAITFDDEEHLLHVVQRIVGRVGRRVDESSPMVDARLPDGSRVNAIIRPVALDGALVSIRRFGGTPLSPEALIARGTISAEWLNFLGSCVRARKNILVSGGTGSGKTTLLNILSGFIPADERIVTIEDAAELRLQQAHVARMETRPPNIEGHGQVTTRDLLRNALRMRPDRIVVGECRGGEAFDMLQAMNTGHNGSLTTLHANSASDAISRLEMLVSLSQCELPPATIHRQIVAGLHLVVQVARLATGERRVTQISEVKGLRQGEVELRELYQFQSPVRLN